MRHMYISHIGLHISYSETTNGRSEITQFGAISPILGMSLSTVIHVVDMTADLSLSLIVCGADAYPEHPLFITRDVKYIYTVGGSCCRLPVTSDILRGDLIKPRYTRRYLPPNWVDDPPKKTIV